MHYAIIIQVYHNKHLILPGENYWAFGQVLSIVMIASILREILELLPYFLRCYGMICGVGVVDPDIDVSEWPMY